MKEQQTRQRASAGDAISDQLPLSEKSLKRSSKNFLSNGSISDKNMSEDLNVKESSEGVNFLALGNLLCSQSDSQSCNDIIQRHYRNKSCFSDKEVSRHSEGQEENKPIRTIS